MVIASRNASSPRIDPTSTPRRTLLLTRRPVLPPSTDAEADLIQRQRDDREEREDRGDGEAIERLSRHQAASGSEETTSTSSSGSLEMARSTTWKPTISAAPSKAISSPAASQTRMNAMTPRPIRWIGGPVLADRFRERVAVRSAAGGARGGCTRRRSGTPGRVADVHGRHRHPPRATPQVGGDREDHRRHDDDQRQAAKVLERRVDHGPRRTCDVGVPDPGDDRVLGGADGKSRDQERDDRADAEVDQHPASIPRQPQRERDEGDAQDDEQDDDQIEDADDRASRLQPVGGHQLDRPEVGRERHTERGLEALGERLGRFRGRQVGELHVRRG